MTRVAVTTDRFGEVADYYAEAGLTPVPVPTIQVVTAAGPAQALARRLASNAEMLLVTSPRTPRLLWPGAGMPVVPVAAVGEETASEVSRRGGTVVLVGKHGLADLAEEMVTIGCPRRIVFPRAAGSDPASLAPLRQAGVEVVELDVYRSVSVPPASTPVDAVTFASPSAVEGWVSGRSLDGLVVAAIGMTTAAAVAAQRRPDVVAEKPSHREMAAALAQYMEVEV